MKHGGSQMTAGECIMKLHVENLKFRYQIIVLFLILFLFLSMGSGISFYYLSVKNVTDNFSNSASNTVGQMRNTLDIRMEIISDRAKSMLLNNAFSDPIVSYVNNPTLYNQVVAHSVVSDYLSDFERGEALIDSSCLFAGGELFDDYVRIRKPDFEFQNSLYYTIYQENPLAVQWIPPIENPVYYGENPVISCERRFKVPGCSEWFYFIYHLDSERLFNLITGQYPFFDDIVVLDADGNHMIGNQTIEAEELLGLWEEKETDTKEILSADLTVQGQEYLVKSCDISTNGWKLFGLKSKTELLDSLRTLRRKILGISLFLLIVGLVSIIWVSRRLTASLSRLERSMRSVQNGEFNARFFYPYQNEVGSLSRSFNCMIEEIQSLVKKQEQSIEDLIVERNRVAEIQKQKRHAELKALQAQINPHFLYNTLNTITWQAADQGIYDVSRMANSLGKFFRLSLSRGAEVISLADEIEHVRCYLSIQQIRYQDKLRYRIEVPEALLGCRVLKLILQPLVENAIYHGIKEKEGIGEIVITASAEMKDGNSVLSLYVYDNGVGIPEEKLTQIHRGLRFGVKNMQDGYGIYNVNERIGLYYGASFGLSYESQAGVCTKAIITIPMKNQEEKIHV